jgi:hypothetical protein
MSENNLYGFDNENTNENMNNMNEEMSKKDGYLGINNYDSAGYADFRQSSNSINEISNEDNTVHNTYDRYENNNTYDMESHIGDTASNQHIDTFENSYETHEETVSTDDYAHNTWKQQNSYGYVNNEDNNNEGRNEETGRKNSRARRKGSVFKRVVGISAAALLFGTVAGGTMFGVNNLATNLIQTEEETVAHSKKASEVSTVELKEASTAVTTANSSSPTVADVSPIVESAMPSVVAIKGTTSVEAYSWFGEDQSYDAASSGSGIIIGKNDTELLIVTNNHVVEDTKDLSVVFIDNEEVKAAIKGRDSDNDIAIIAVKLADIKPETIEKIAVAQMGDSDELKVGQGVVAIGNALGYGQSVTVGYVSAIDREVTTKDSSIKNLLQTDAAINPGNSGGALLNMSGEVIGINTAKYASTEVEGMGYAIPISKVKDIIADLSSKETRSDKVDEAKQGYLGIQGKNIGEEVAEAYDMPRGVYVYKIVENSSAANSDLREKDIITKIDAQSVKSMEDLKDILSYYQSGEKIKLTVQRLNDSTYEEKEIEITLSDRSALQ